MTKPHMLKVLGRVVQRSTDDTRSPLRGLHVDVYCATLHRDAVPSFVKLNGAAAKTDRHGLFLFDEVDLASAVPVDDSVATAHSTAFHGTSDDDEESLDELPADAGGDGTVYLFVYRVTAVVQAEPADASGGSRRTGDEDASVSLVEIFDERQAVSEKWLEDNPRRLVRIHRSRKRLFRTVTVPPSSATAASMAGDNAGRGFNIASFAPKGSQFAFIGVFRATYDEIGSFADPRPQFAGKTGYFRSADSAGSRLPYRYDAPFGGRLSLQGAFGGDLATKENLYYSVTISRYAGDPALPYDETKLVDSTYNTSFSSGYYFEYYQAGSVDGKWRYYTIGPFFGKVGGATVAVYRRRLPGPADKEQNPDPFFLCYWSVPRDAEGLHVVTLQAYVRTGGTDASPILEKIELDANQRLMMPLMIDNHEPFIRFDKVYPSDPGSYTKLRVAYCKFGGGAEELGAPTDIDDCNEVVVVPGQKDGNEGILILFTVCDRFGVPLKHVKEYKVLAMYTPRSTSDSPDNLTLDLKPTFTGCEPLSQQYKALGIPGPIWTIARRQCVLLPSKLDGWPPEKGDPHKTPCSQYGAGLFIEAWSRTIDGGFEVFYERSRTSRYIVLRTNSGKCS